MWVVVWVCFVRVRVGCVLYVGAYGCGHVIVCSYSAHACVK